MYARGCLILRLTLLVLNVHVLAKLDDTEKLLTSCPSGSIFHMQYRTAIIAISLIKKNFLPPFCRSYRTLVIAIPLIKTFFFLLFRRTYRTVIIAIPLVKKFFPFFSFSYSESDNCNFTYQQVILLSFCRSYRTVVIPIRVPKETSNVHRESIHLVLDWRGITLNMLSFRYKIHLSKPRINKTFELLYETQSSDEININSTSTMKCSESKNKPRKREKSRQHQTSFSSRT